MTHPGEQFYPEGVRWDDTIVQGSLPDLLAKAAAEYGPRTALEFRDRPITYTELAAMAERAAAAFLRAGCGKNTSIALFLGNTPDHPVNFFGALKAGARVAHLSPLDGEIALTHKVSDSGSRLLVTSNLAALLPTALKFLEKGLIDRLVVCEDDNWGKVGTPQATIPSDPRIVTFKAFVEGATAPAQWPKVTADDVALLQYTGGTTGLPKGAMLTHGNLTSAVSIYDVWGKPSRATRGDAIERVICVLPLFHIYALTVVLLSTLSRGNLISLHQRFDVEAVMRDIEVKRATYFPGVPTMWIAIASASRPRQTRLLLAQDHRLRRRAAAGGGRQLLRAQDRQEAQERLGHDRDLLARHRPSAGRARQAGLDRPDAARHRARRRRAGRSDQGAAAGRSRRDPHQGPERHPGLLE